jgi:hypothetical protein
MHKLYQCPECGHFFGQNLPDVIPALILVSLTLLVDSMGQARADFIVNQTPADGDNIISQVFPNQSTSTTFAFR